MKKLYLFGACVLLLLLASSGQAVPLQDAIHCIGTESGGGGVRLYNYDIYNGEEIPLDKFVVGTDDLTVANYTNWLMPFGWSASIVGGASFWGPIWKNDYKTDHGLVAPTTPPEGSLTAGVVLFQCAPLSKSVIPSGGTASFGFDNLNPSVNVDWYTLTRMWVGEEYVYVPGGTAAGANWLSPVGTGVWEVWTDGPVHGPVPEPATMMLLGFGALGLLRKRRA